MANLSAHVPPGGPWSRDADAEYVWRQPGPVMEGCGCGCVKGEWKPARYLRHDNRLMARRTGNAGWGVMCKSSVILRQQHSSHGTVGLGDDPEAILALTIG